MSTILGDASEDEAESSVRHDSPAPMWCTHNVTCDFRASQSPPVKSRNDASPLSPQFDFPWDKKIMSCEESEYAAPGIHLCLSTLLLISDLPLSDVHAIRCVCVHVFN